MIEKLVQRAVVNVFNRHFSLAELVGLVERFEAGTEVEVGELVPSRVAPAPGRRDARALARPSAASTSGSRRPASRAAWSSCSRGCTSTGGSTRSVAAAPCATRASGLMSLYRYARWDGSQSLPPFDADDVLDALSDDILAEGDIRRALQRLMQRGMRGTRGGDVPGLRRIVEQLRARRAEELERAHLDGMLDDVAARLDAIVEQERAGIERRLGEVEQQIRDAPPGPAQDQARMGERILRRTAQQRRDRLDRLPPDVAGRLSGPARLRVHGRRCPRRLQRAHRRAPQAAAGDLLPGAEGGASPASRRRTSTGCAPWCATSIACSRSTPPGPIPAPTSPASWPATGTTSRRGSRRSTS